MSHHPEDSSYASFAERVREFAVDFDGRLDEFLRSQEEIPSELLNAVRYSALAPGKRLRPFLVVRCCELVGGDIDEAWWAAAAIESVHAFSLIHDDLPAMDDDDVRRGQPTCHKKFGEAQAILAGDALVVLAFELLSQATEDPRVNCELVGELASATGWRGMIGGQAVDVASQSAAVARDLVEIIHLQKTSRLFECACRMGAIVGRADAEAVDELARFGQMVGLAFQIGDDLLDLTATEGALGKAVAKDAKAGKQTFPGCVGVEESRMEARRRIASAIAALTRYGPDADDLRSLARFMVERNY